MTSEPEKDGVVAVLSDGSGRHLYIRRGLTIARAPGYWCFVGGEVEAGESIEAAIVREVFEEVGLEIRALEKIHESVSPNGEFRLHWMRVELTRPGQEVRPHEKEVADSRWLTMEEALKLEPILSGLKAWLTKQLKQ